MPDMSLFRESGTNAGNNFFSYFNSNGALTGLPAGSFDTSNITSAGNNFFYNFNYNGALTDLPTSFKRPNISAILNGSNNFTNAFNSPNYTLNRNVINIINGNNSPSSDRNTFSNNQPGVCGVHDNWKVTV
jgi:surface protein